MKYYLVVELDDKTDFDTVEIDDYLTVESISTDHPKWYGYLRLKVLEKTEGQGDA